MYVKNKAELKLKVISNCYSVVQIIR
jgi:hypothetical protein